MPATQFAKAVVSERPLPSLPTGLPFVRGETSRKLIRAGLRAAGIRLRWPVDTPTAFSLLKLIGYSADRPCLSHCLKRQYLPFPKKSGGNFEWTEQDCINLADALESLRRWVPMHPAHVHKYNPRELADAREKAQERIARLRELCGWTVGELAEALVKSDNPETREAIVMALQIRTGAIDCKGDGSEAPAADVGEN